MEALIVVVVTYTLRRGEHAWECQARIDGRPHLPDVATLGVAAYPAEAFADMARLVALQLDSNQVPVYRER